MESCVIVRKKGPTKGMVIICAERRRCEVNF